MFDLQNHAFDPWPMCIYCDYHFHNIHIISLSFSCVCVPHSWKISIARSNYTLTICMNVKKLHSKILICFFFFSPMRMAWMCGFAKFNAKLYICLHACDHIKFTGLCTQFSMWIPKNGSMYLLLLCVNMFAIIDHICLGQRITLWHTNNRYIPTNTNIMAYNQFITSIETEKKGDKSTTNRIQDPSVIQWAVSKRSWNISPNRNFDSITVWFLLHLVVVCLFVYLFIEMHVWHCKGHFHYYMKRCLDIIPINSQMATISTWHFN